jgi:hypothetical protein
MYYECIVVLIEPWFKIINISIQLIARKNLSPRHRRPVAVPFYQNRTDLFFFLKKKFKLFFC